MKLCGKDIVAPDRRGKIISVIRARGDDGLIRWLWIEAVHEIDIAAVFNSAIERAIGFHNFQLVPADLRDFQSGFLREADNAAGKNAKAGGTGIKFLAAFKQRLVADADAEKRFAGRDEIFRGLEQFLFAERVDAIVKRADAGQHEAARITDFFGVLHEPHVRANLEQRLMDTAQIAGAVIEKSNHETILATDAHG